MEDRSNIVGSAVTNTEPNSLVTLTYPRFRVQSLELSENGKDFVKSWESSSLKYYDDNRGFCTVGWGHLVGGLTSCAHQRRTGSITIEDAHDLFATDVPKHEELVRSAILVPLYQNEFDALCSLAYNVGSLRKIAPTLCRKINSGDYAGGAAEILDITNNGMSGLVKRRRQEYAMFLACNYDSTH